MPPAGYFCLPFLSLLRIRILCTSLWASRNINQHQLKLRTPVRYHELSFLDKNQSSPDRERVSNRGDTEISTPLLLWTALPLSCFLSQMSGTKCQGKQCRCLWNLPKHLSDRHTAEPGLGTPWLPGPQPAHSCGQSRTVLPIHAPADQIVLVIWVQHGASPARLLPFQS